jgi:hypothetical protein
VCPCPVAARAPEPQPPAGATRLAYSMPGSHLPNAALTPLQAQASDSNPIAPQFQDGFLQTAVSKAPRRATLVHPRYSRAPGRSRYSTKVSQPQSSTKSPAVLCSPILGNESGYVPTPVCDPVCPAGSAKICSRHLSAHPLTCGSGPVVRKCSGPERGAAIG